ncbi:MAG TPA: hypothetical protein VJ955_08580 [Desulfuromonadales bacterium]|nr:hypothetical protein [Desulfuromonadales bacterium]
MFVHNKILQIRWMLVSFLALWCVLQAAVLRAAPSVPVSSVAAFPSSLGTIVYQLHSDMPCQLYIVANSHRSCATGANGSKTLRAQIETFRIGEWLLKRKHLDLLLPEGFFGHDNATELPHWSAVRLDGQTLEKRLADTSTFVNAELLLHRHYGIGLYQVEDAAIYNRAKALLRSGLKDGAVLSPGFGKDLNYLQERRLAAILQNVPTVLSHAERRERISTPTAMLTIGLAHLPDIIRYLKNGNIRISPAPGSKDLFPSFHTQLTLDRQDIGITVIVPHSLLSSRKLAQVASSFQSAKPTP